MGEKLEQALECLINIQNTSGMNAKRDLLMAQKENDTMKDIIYFVFNPYIRTGIGYTKLMNCVNDTSEPYDGSIQGLITYLLHNNTGRDKDVKIVKYWIESCNPSKYQDILYKIFTKSMNIGISYSTIHKVWPGLIPGFGVQLACKYPDCMEDLKGKEIFLTEKLDGNRCFARVENGVCTFFSRSGREIEGLDEIDEDLTNFVDGWYDGELIAETFNETQSQTLKKGKKSNLVFNVFDYLTLKEVAEQNCTHNYLIRRQFMEQIFRCREEFEHVKIVPLIGRGIYDHDWVMSVLEDYVSGGSEGIMINQNEPYQFWRTGWLIKVKKMYTVDLKVLRVERGNGQNEDKLGHVVVDYKGYEVGVGSGFSKEQRIYWWEHPEDIIGKIIEVQAFEETKDKQGNLSLRFPVFKRVRDDKEEPSYD